MEVSFNSKLPSFVMSLEFSILTPEILIFCSLEMLSKKDLLLISRELLLPMISIFLPVKLISWSIL